MRAAAVLLALVAAAIWAAPAAAAPPTPAEVELATTYAPVLELKDQPRPCEAGEPYEPTDIDLLMGNDEIALRGPWDTTNIVSVAPRAAELGRGSSATTSTSPATRCAPAAPTSSGPSACGRRRRPRPTPAP